MDKLWEAFDEMKKSGNCNAYVGVIADQLQLLGTESNTLTKVSIKEKLLELVEKIDETL